MTYAWPAGPEDPAYIKYQAESPDEAALGGSGESLRLLLSTAATTRLCWCGSLQGDGEVEMEYQNLNILEFDSTRKRMSVICRNPEGNIMLYCKVCCSCPAPL